ncbi:MAG: hypothetical protein MSO56_10590 [Clostridiales bacterium]|nr:hypothetical protein [Clostridiales bacterium]
MKEKHINIAIATVLMCIDAVFLYSAFTAREYKGAIVGPFDFAKYLGIMLAVLCVIIIIQSLFAKTKEEKIVITHFDLVLITVSATALLLILWKSFGLFYLWGLLYVFGLFIAYCGKSEKLTLKKMLGLGILSVAVMLAIFLLFRILMGINL